MSIEKEFGPQNQSSHVSICRVEFLFVFGFHLQNEIQDFAAEVRLTLYHRFLDRSTKRMSDLASQSDS